MVVKKDNNLKKERKKKEKKKPLREGLTSQKVKSDAKKGAAATAWASFVSATVHTIIFLWILFPFYSWQLQIIFDQARCQTPGDKGCPLPSNKDLPPYCPGPNVGHGCRETLNGPDSLNAILEFFTHTLVQIYEIITGMVWIKADEEIKKMEKHVANHKSQPKTMPKRGGGKHEAARKSFIPFRSATKHSSTYGQAVDIAEKVLGTTAGVDLKTLESAKCCGDVLQYENVEQHAKCKPGFSLFDVEPFKSIFPKDFGWPYTYLFNAQKINPDDGKPIPGKFFDTRYNPKGSADESTPKRWLGAWFAKTQQRSWSASRSVWSMILMFFFPFLHDELDFVEVEIRINNFIDGLDAKIADLKAEPEYIAYIKYIAKEEMKPPPSDNQIGGLGVTAAQTGQVGPSYKDRQDDAQRRAASTRAVGEKKNEVVGAVEKIRKQFGKIKESFKAQFPEKDGVYNGGNVEVRKKLYDVIAGSKPRGNDYFEGAEMMSFHEAEAARLTADEKTASVLEHKKVALDKSKGEHKKRQGELNNRREKRNLKSNKGASEGGGLHNMWHKQKQKQAKNKLKSGYKTKNGGIDNIFLDFYIAVTKPPQHERTQSGKEKKSHWSRFMNPFGGDTRYWIRYIVTWYIPILMMIILTISIFTGFWFTAVSSINRYSNFILPLTGGILVALVNMFAQPISVFFYLLFGGSSSHKDSKKCPYDSGLYQMRRNMKQYFWLNLYITLAIIVTHLGIALAASGKRTIGMILSSIFPIYTLIIIIIKLFHWLWYLA